jgi:hypothetical protein
MSLLTEASLLLTPNAYKEGKLYSIIPSNGNGDFTVTRATTATRVNAAGLVDLVPYNLFTWSEMFSNAAWGKASVTISANTTTAPDGTLTADTLIGDGTNTPHYINTNTPVLNGTAYSYSVYAKKNTNNFLQLFGGIGFPSTYFANFDLNNGVTGTIGAGTTASIQSVGNGWYRCTITGTANSTSLSLTIGLGIVASATSVRAESNTLSTSIFLWGAQLVQGTSARDYLRTETRLNIPRIDYSLGGCPNILLEPQRTNGLLNTVFSGSGAAPTSWTQAVGTGTSTLTASTLGVGAQACSQSATAERPFLSQSFTLVASTTYSYSIYIESISGVLTNDNVLLASGLPLGATTSYFANGISVSPTALAVVGRLSITIVVSSTGGSAAFRCGIGTSSNQTGTLLFSRPQLEAGAYATSFIPTTTASVTRNADSITRNNIFTNGLITAAGGTWFVELRNNVARVRDAGANSLFLGDTISGNTNSFIFRNSVGTNTRLAITKRFVGSETILYTTLTDNLKVAIKWNGSTADVFVNGTKVVTATAFTTTNMEFLNGNGNDVPKYINEMALFPTALTDTQCIALTT